MVKLRAAISDVIEEEGELDDDKVLHQKAPEQHIFWGSEEAESFAEIPIEKASHFHSLVVAPANSGFMIVQCAHLSPGELGVSGFLALHLGRSHPCTELRGIYHLTCRKLQQASPLALHFPFTRCAMQAT